MEVAYCHEHAIQHSKFLTWPEEDQDKIIAYDLYKAQICPSCGTNPDEWLDDGELVEPLPYVPYSRRCHGCATLEEERAKIGHNKTQYHTYLQRNPDAGGTG